MSPQDISAILTRLDQQDKTLDEIKTQVKLTNGRVTTLEADRLVKEALAGEAKTRGKEIHNLWGGLAAAGVGSIILILAHVAGVF